MLTRTKITFLVMAIAGIPGSLWAADDPFVGTWKINIAKSTFYPGPPPLGSSGGYEYELNPGGGLKVSVIVFNANGKSSDHSRIETYDGKPHPVEGDPGAYAIATRRPTPYIIEGENERKGQPPLYFFRLVSQDGKTLTVTFDSMNEKGERTQHDVRVYEKQ